MCQQYVGQTVDISSSRWNNYKINYRKYLVGEPCTQEHIFEYFNSEGHTVFSQNVFVTFIDKTGLQNPEKRIKLLGPHFKDHSTLGIKYHYHCLSNTSEQYFLAALYIHLFTFTIIFFLIRCFYCCFQFSFGLFKLNTMRSEH